MPNYSEEIIQQVVQATDIVDLISQYVPLKKQGARYFACCPFHNEKTPSFYVDPVKKLYYCFGCHAGGNVFHFVMEKENLNFPQAVEFLADKAGIILPKQSGFDEKKEKEREQLYEINRKAGNFFYKCLKNSQQSLEYLKQRNISTEMVRSFGLGYAPDSWNDLINYLKSEGYTDEEILKAGLAKKGEKNVYDAFRNRLIIPILNPMGKLIAFGGRKFSDEEQGAKYLNSPETAIFNKRNQLFNLNKAKSLLRENPLILVEGYMDVIALYGHGIKNVVAALGTAFTKEHVKLISHYTNEVILCFDGDSAGEKATVRALDILDGSNLHVKVVRLKDNEDPDSYINKYGLEDFNKQLDLAQNSKEFLFEYLKGNYNLNNPDELAQYTMECCKSLINLNPIEQNIYAKKIAEITGVSQQALESQLQSLKPKEKPTVKVQQGQNRNRTNRIPKRLEEAQRIVIAYCYKNPDYIKKSKIFEFMFCGKFYKWIYKRLRELNKVEPDITLILDQDDPEMTQVLSRFLISIDNIDISQVEKASSLVKFYYKQRETIRLKNTKNTEEDQEILFSRIMEFKKAGLTDYE